MLTFRALCQSERFERAWPLLVGTYQRKVRLPQRVIALSGHRSGKEYTVNMRPTPSGMDR
jgi:hypothetical protein